MTIYYQHIGEAAWRDHGPLSITESDRVTLRQTRLEALLRHLDRLDPVEHELMKQRTVALAPTGFQVWGFPARAEKALREMESGDWLLLIDTDAFRYTGQILHYVSVPCHDLSEAIWGSAAYPLIVLLDGNTLSVPWEPFREAVQFDPG